MAVHVRIGRPGSPLAWEGKGVTEVTLIPRTTGMGDFLDTYLREKYCAAKDMLLGRGYKRVDEADENCPSRPMLNGEAFYKLVDDDAVVVALRKCMGQENADTVSGELWSVCGAEAWL